MIRKGIHATAVIDVQGKAILPETTVMEPQAVIFVGPDGTIELGEQNTLYPQCSIRIDKGWMRTGVEVSFGPGVMIYEPRGGLEIGDHCMIAAGTAICGVQHGAERLDIPMRHQPPQVGKIVIEDDVWIGMRVVIFPGVTIGRHSIIGAGSVVTRDIPPRSIAWGSPCEVRQTRS